MNYQNLEKWVERVVRDGLVHAQCGGSFETFIAGMLHHKVSIILDDLNTEAQFKLQNEIERQKADIYAKAYKDGQKSVSDTSAYDNGYKKGYKDASDIAESNRRWDSFKPGDMK